MPNVVPGITNRILFPITADVNAGVTEVAVVAGWSAKTPLTKLASFMSMVVLTGPLAAVMAERVNCGRTSDFSAVLRSRDQFNWLSDATARWGLTGWSFLPSCRR